MGIPQLHLMEYSHLIDSLELLRGAQKAGIKLEPETIAKMKSV